MPEISDAIQQGSDRDTVAAVLTLDKPGASARDHHAPEGAGTGHAATQAHG